MFGRVKSSIQAIPRTQRIILFEKNVLINFSSDLLSQLRFVIAILYHLEVEEQTDVYTTDFLVLQLLIM